MVLCCNRYCIQISHQIIKGSFGAELTWDYTLPPDTEVCDYTCAFSIASMGMIMLDTEL